MSLIVNLRHLEHRNLILRGELSLAELNLGLHDEMIRATQPLRYDLEVEMLDDSLLVQGSLRLALECECVRCLKKFKSEVKLAPWTQDLPLAGEEAVSINNDCVDLTPVVREDILIEFPQHPLCKPDCGGLKQTNVGKPMKTSGKIEPKPSAWAELNKLKL
jgi:uncharacterized protein